MDQFSRNCKFPIIHDPPKVYFCCIPFASNGNKCCRGLKLYKAFQHNVRIMIHDFADPFLRGDFALWLAIHEYRLAKMIGEVRQSWKREVEGRFIGFTEDRKAIYVREHMFQSDVDYLSRLKSER